MYRELFLGETNLRKELQADAEAITKAAAEKIAAMTDEQKQQMFERMMRNGRRDK